MAKKVAQVLTTLGHLVKQLAKESEKSEEVSLIVFCGKKNENWNPSYLNTSAMAIYGAVMELCNTIGCDKDELSAIAKEVMQAIERKGPLMEVVKEEVISEATGSA